MATKKILIQLDPDLHCSVFDAVVAIDSKVDHLLQYSAVEPVQVRDLVYGAIFTRGVDQLRNTAVFIGGKDVSRGEALLQQITESFFGPMRVSVLMDANGANTTAAAAVVAAERHIDLSTATALVLAATGPVGQRAVRMLARAGGTVRVGSRRLERAAAVCGDVAKALDASVDLIPVATSSDEDIVAAIEGAEIVIAAGASGIQLLSQAVWQSATELKVAIDLNAVPPLGIEGVAVTDKPAEHDGKYIYGAVGVGGTKMRIHKECIRRLFRTNDLVLDADEVFKIGQELEARKR
jgi:hypothetical protein